ncbi:MAG: 2-isopropylmalate synthase [Syntrophomonas sp.]|nr:2-isopropylmalate synthase [Syntrophomonas sp.]
MKNIEKYARAYFMPPEVTYDWVKKDYIDKVPIWCSVDLRDGNQALIEPMGLEEKLEYFQLLVDIGFKEIEVGFPAASDTEYRFVRTIIERNLIPDDVTIQVLTQAREKIIRKTFAAIKGAPHAIVHLYNSTSVAQRKQVFKMSKEKVKEIAIKGAKLVKKLADETNGDFLFEYSPESFPGTEVEYALEVCNAVIDIWQPSPDKKVIINIPATVEIAMPHVFACQVEYMIKHLNHRENIIVSLHPHNDRGSAVSDAELGILAGAERIEGTLFGNGERTGNLDIITVAMNMFSHGVNPQLDFSNINAIADKYRRLTGMYVHERMPYSGELVFTAFSGSHQDAIAKGMKWREAKESPIWSVPYLPIDPRDLGREYESDIIRINSQSGKGGVSYILKQSFGLSIPEQMKEEVGYIVKNVSDREHKELSPAWIYNIFEELYVTNTPIFTVSEFHFTKRDGGIVAEVTIKQGEEQHIIIANGNGRLDAASNAIRQYFGVEYELLTYEEHALSKGSSSKAAAYVGLIANDKVSWGVGFDEDIIKASIEALTVAANHLESIKSFNESKRDERMIAIMNYIQKNYGTVTLGELSDKFYLSIPYLSKYIKGKTGRTFGEIVKETRMNKAKTLLKSKGMTVEVIAEAVGYENVEHFNRLFKKAYKMTPVQFRNQK